MGSFNLELPCLLAFAAGLVLGMALAAALAWPLVRRSRNRLGRFLANTIHEINAPITAANITLLNLLNGTFGEVGAEHARWLDMTREQFCRLNALMGELYDFVHLTLKQDLVVYPESVLPSVLIDEALAELKRSMAQAPFALQCAVPTDLPKVWVDRSRTVRSLTTLFLYARKFRAAGDLRFTGERRNGAVALRLEYYGQPLSHEETQRSLEVLYPARRRSGHTLNTVGLGLGLLRVLARRQGGNLDFQVSSDGRSVLTLLLPLSKR